MSEKAFLIRSRYDVNESFGRNAAIGACGVLCGVLILFFGRSGPVCFFGTGRETAGSAGLIWAVRICLGGAWMICGIVFPFLVRSLAGCERMNVFEDHISGYGEHLFPGTHVPRREKFSEKLGEVQSVAAGKRVIRVYFRNGKSICCAADNAGEMAEIIRLQLEEPA